MKASFRYAEGRFQNLIRARNQVENGGGWEMVSRYLNGDETRTPSQPIPVNVRHREDFALPPEGGLRLTWMGHSSFLIELDGARVLTDPVWSERASPFGFAGPKRFFSPPMALDELPKLDAVVLSHDHYDHLDMPTVQELSGRGVRFYVPLGVGAHLERWGVPVERITELDWWQRAKVGPLELVATPARHFSGRGLTDRNATLWASWSFLGPTHRVYFSGDTGYSTEFRQIGERLGPFDVTLVEMGAYNSLWADVHLGPEQAVQVHLDVRGKLLVPIHWGTFNLALHAWTEPVERMIVEAARRNVPVAVPKPGDSVVPAQEQLLVRWWPSLPWQTAQQAPVRSSGIDEAFATPGKGHEALEPTGG